MTRLVMPWGFVFAHPSMELLLPLMGMTAVYKVKHVSLISDISDGLTVLLLEN